METIRSIFGTAVPYELTYFPIRGRGAAIVYLLKDLQIPFTYKSVEGDWGEVKLTTPFGQLPVLKDGDFLLGQSGAIMRYLSSKHGLDASTLREKATADMIYSQHDDIRNHYIRLIYQNYKHGKDAYLSDLSKTWAPFEEILKKNNGGDGFFVGDKLYGVNGRSRK